MGLRREGGSPGATLSLTASPPRKKAAKADDTCGAAFELTLQRVDGWIFCIRMSLGEGGRCDGYDSFVAAHCEL